MHPVFLTDSGLMWSLIGAGFYLAAPVYGFIRGVTHYNKLTRVSDMLNNSPIKNTSFDIFSNGRGIGSSIKYSMAF